jgi:hypothetical protein
MNAPVGYLQRLADAGSAYGGLCEYLLVFLMPFKGHGPYGGGVTRLVAGLTWIFVARF